MRSVRPKFVRSATHTALIAAVAIPTVVTACSEEGETPSCPPQPLFNYAHAGEANAPDVIGARDAGVEAGCLTPVGTATSGRVQNMGSGGGSSGSGGKAGKGGATGKGGASNSGGAAGSDPSAGAGGD